MPNYIFKTFISLIIIKFLRHTGDTSYAFSLLPLLLIPSTFSPLPFYLLIMTQNLYDSHVKHVPAYSPCTQPHFVIYSLPSFLHGEEFSSLLRLTLYYLWMEIKYLKPSRLTSTEGCHVFPTYTLGISLSRTLLDSIPLKKKYFKFYL